MKRITLLLIFVSSLTFAQEEKSSKMGQTTLEELKMTVYDKDSTASAVVLYEHANVYQDVNHDNNMRIDYYYRIKILDKNSFDLASIDINTYKKRRAINIKGITYNLTDAKTIRKSNLLDKNVFTTKEGKDWTVKKFTLPNIKEGSIIEYSYSIISPYLSIPDWYFQSDIPKIKSEFDAAILGNYKYNIRTIGVLKLDKNELSIKKNCTYIEGIGSGDCGVYSYGMNNIPAFKEENYMLSKKNYMFRLSFDLESYTSYRGETKKLLNTWKNADKGLKSQFFNNQTSKKSYFKKRLPKNILKIENNLERAKKVFYFIQNHYSWNEKNWTNEDAKIRKAFDEKVGNVGEVNLSLYNALKVTEIEAYPAVLSTRENGIPTKLYPIIYDFNYVIVKVVIEGKTYFLDATDKFLPFGQIPTRCLNGEARVLDFKKKSYWETVKPIQKTSKNVVVKLVLNDNLEGNIMVRRNGYLASNQRKKIASTSENEYLENLESENSDLEIDDYTVKNLGEIEKSIQEIFTIKLINDDVGLENKIRINPFFFDRITENPFKLKERNYPVDFSYPRKRNYSLRLQIPENYSVINTPKDIAISLPNKGGRFILKTVVKENIINTHLRVQINKKIYSNEEYYYLKEFFNQIIQAQNSFIILEKK